MKKLIAILLVLASMLALGSCGATNQNEPSLTPPATNLEAQEILDTLAELIRTSTPTQSKVSTLTGTENINLKSDLTITMGELSGKEAALYVHEYESFNELGAQEAKTLTVETKEYVEGMGLRIDGGMWEREQSSFVRRITPYRMALDAETVQSLRTNEEKTEFSFVVPMDNASDVFTNFDGKTLATIASDISVRVETDGTAVTMISIEYGMKSVANMENPTVKITALYSYDLQSITLLG